MPETPPPRSRTRSLLGLVFGLVALGFLASFIARDLDRLREYPWDVDAGLLGLSLLVQISGLFWGVLTWRRLLRIQGHPIGLIPLARIWFVSGLGRYIPGKIWQFLGAAHLGSARGLPPGVTMTSLAAHTVFFLTGALLTSAVLVPSAALGLDPTAAAAFRVAAAASILVVHPTVIRAALGLIHRLSGRTVGEWTGRWTDALVLIAFSIGAWVITGFGLYLFLRALTPIALADAPQVIGFNALAFVAGYLFFIAPAGLGAKDGVLAALLATWVPVSVAALLAVAARVWTIASEVIPAVVLAPRRGPGHAPVPPDESPEA